MERVGGEVLLELDGSRAENAVLRDLAAEGFTSVEVISDLSARFPYRRLFVNAAIGRRCNRSWEWRGSEWPGRYIVLPDRRYSLIPTGQVMPSFLRHIGFGGPRDGGPIRRTGFAGSERPTSGLRPRATR
jgi:hypothetical protein